AAFCCARKQYSQCPRPRDRKSRRRTGKTEHIGQPRMAPPNDSIACDATLPADRQIRKWQGLGCQAGRVGWPPAPQAVQNPIGLRRSASIDHRLLVPARPQRPRWSSQQTTTRKVCLHSHYNQTKTRIDRKEKERPAHLKRRDEAEDRWSQGGRSNRSLSL